MIGLLGAATLSLYGIVPTYQGAHFGRIYATYGGSFVVLSILWGWGIDRVVPDRYDLLGGAICLAGVGLIRSDYVFATVAPKPSRSWPLPEAHLHTS